MCVILNSGPGIKTAPVEHLVASNTANPHGWGVAISLPVPCESHRAKGPIGACAKCREVSSVLMTRGFDTGGLLDAVARVDALRTPLSSLVVHCRIATGGDISLGNTHPFEVTDKVLLFHNGIFSEQAIPTTLDPSKPDSYHLAKAIAPEVSADPLRIISDAFTEDLNALCVTGYPSKVLLLDAVYGSVRFNQNAWVDGGEGRQYSNAGPLFGIGDYETDEDFWADQEDSSDYVDYKDLEDSHSEWATWKDDIRLFEDLEEEARYAHRRERGLPYYTF